MNSPGGPFAFGPFVLDPVERRLTCDGRSVDVSGRYFDALTLLVAEHGKLVSKDRLHEEVWRGIPVTDEAITQCIRSLRRELGDEAGNPRFIETVPRHGYRFIAAVQAAAPSDSRQMDPAVPQHAEAARIALSGLAGGATAGLVGGLFYGLAIAGEGPTGGASTVLALASITLLVATLGAAGVSFGIAAASLARANRAVWTLAGGALGGAFVGGLVKLIGVDALALLFGSAPRGITGAGEGLAIGAAVAIGLLMAARPGTSLRRGIVLASLLGGLAGLAITLAGGRLMGGSLALLAETAPGSRLDLAPLGLLAAQDRFGVAAQTVAAGLEGALFAAGIAAAMLWAGRQDAPGAKSPRSAMLAPVSGTSEDVGA